MSDYTEKFEKMRATGNLAAKTLDMLTDYIKPGVATDELDCLGYEFIKDHGAYSAPQFYRGNKKSLGMKYTPDFIGDGFIIECKGRANESFPIRWKIFKKYVNYQLRGVTLYKPQNQKECDTTVRLILEKRT